MDSEGPDHGCIKTKKACNQQITLKKDTFVVAELMWAARLIVYALWLSGATLMTEAPCAH